MAVCLASFGHFWPCFQCKAPNYFNPKIDAPKKWVLWTPAPQSFFKKPCTEAMNCANPLLSEGFSFLFISLKWEQTQQVSPKTAVSFRAIMFARGSRSTLPRLAFGLVAHAPGGARQMPDACVQEKCLQSLSSGVGGGFPHPTGRQRIWPRLRWGDSQRP